MTSTGMTKVAIIGSGNVGTDLMIKIKRLSDSLEVAAMVGIDPDSGGLARARRLGVATTAGGVHGLIAMAAFDDISSAHCRTGPCRSTAKPSRSGTRACTRASCGMPNRQRRRTDSTHEAC